MGVTAVVLSAQPVTLQVPGVTVLGHVGAFGSAAGLLAARFAAIERVRTSHFFFLDDDDELPEDFGRVLDQCLRRRAAVAYTNELVVRPDGSACVRRSAPYRREDWRRSLTVIHRLAVCRTAAALRAMARVPRGRYGFEPLLYPEIAKEGAAWVDEVGYIWRQRAGSLSHNPDVMLGMAQSIQRIFGGRHGQDD